MCICLCYTGIFICKMTFRACRFVVRCTISGCKTVYRSIKMYWERRKYQQLP